MKQLFLVLGMALMSLSAYAKDIKTLVVTTTPQMHCAGCENRIKNGLKFEKGVKDIQTSVPNQTVTVKYDAEKTTAEELTKAFEKIGFKVSAVNGKVEAKAEGVCPNANK